MRLKLLVLGSILLLTIPACKRQEALQFPEAPVIIITVDTLRSDRLPVYGYDKVETPAIDAFAEDSVLFENAWAHTPMTLPSHASMFTGKLPPNNGVRENVGFRLADEESTLAEQLKQEGYQTGAAISTMVLRKSTGIAQGFDFYDDTLSFGEKANIRTFQERSGQATGDLTTAWMANHKGKPFLAWFHMYEPHTPYNPPQPFKDRYADRPYDGEIAYSDAILGRFFEQLKKEGIYDKAIIFLVSDHGEGLGDHGELEHGLLVYREAIQIPFLVKLPGSVRGGERVSENVGLIDVAPTVLDLLGMNSEGADGMPLFGDRAIPKDRDIYSEAMTPELLYGWHASRSVVNQDLHYIETFETQLFDLEKDPAEKNNIFGTRKIPSGATALMDAMLGGKQETAEISQEDKDMLESLGYTGGFESSDSALAMSFDQFLESVNTLRLTSAMINEDKLDEAREILEKQLGQYPDMLDFRLNLIHVLNLQENFQAAEYLAMEGLATSSGHPNLLLGLVAAQLGLKKFEEAGKIADKCMDEAPVLSGRKLVLQFFEAGDYKKSAQLARDLMVHEPDFAFAYSVLAEVAAEEKADIEQVLARALQQANVPNEKVVDGLYFLADSLARLGRYEEALPVFRESLSKAPDHAPSRSGLCKLYVSMDQPRKAIEVIDSWVYEFPSKGNYLKAAETMAEVGIREAAEFYRKEAGKHQD